MVVGGGEGVLGHDVDEAAGAGRPVDADQTLAVGEALLEAVALDAAREGEVFDNFHAESGEATDLLVGLATDEVEGADADGIAGIGVGDAPRAGQPRGP